MLLAILPLSQVEPPPLVVLVIRSGLQAMWDLVVLVEL